MGYKGSKWNLYEYVSSIPIAATDPRGLSDWVWPWDPNAEWWLGIPNPIGGSWWNQRIPVCDHYGAAASAAFGRVGQGPTHGEVVIVVGGTLLGGTVAAAGTSPVVAAGGVGVGAGSLGVGSTAVVAPHLGAGIYPALLINGTVYVARFHAVAWEMAGCDGVVQKYGMVVIDACGRVIRWL